MLWLRGVPSWPVILNKGQRGSKKSLLGNQRALFSVGSATKTQTGKDALKQQMSLREHHLWFRHKAASRPDYLQCTAPATAAMCEPEEETNQICMLSSTSRTFPTWACHDPGVQIPDSFSSLNSPSGFYFGRNFKVCKKIYLSWPTAF